MTFAGRVPPDDIWRYYAEADIYLQTPDIDNMPSSVLEAFASGCPVVATNAGGVPAILTDELHGLLVDCNDDQSAADAVFRLLEDPALARRLADAALDTCARYQWSSVRAQWIALYRRMASPRRDGRADTGMSARGSAGPSCRDGPAGGALPPAVRARASSRDISSTRRGRRSGIAAASPASSTATPDR